MILVDTSVWIDFFLENKTTQTGVLELLVSEEQDICTCGIIMAEVLQGVRKDSQYKEIKTYFDDLLFLPMPKKVYVDSAKLYRSLRKKGITISKPLDCMIASVAISHDIELLHNDSDFEHIEEHSKLRTL